MLVCFNQLGAANALEWLSFDPPGARYPADIGPASPSTFILILRNFADEPALKHAAAQKRF
jgi:hypothetical protein